MQQRVLERIVQTRPEFLNLAGMAKDLGITYVTLKQHLEALDRKGLLTFESHGRGRSPTVRLPGVQTLEEAIAELERYGWWIEGPRPTESPVTWPAWVVWRLSAQPIPRTSTGALIPVEVARGTTWRKAYDLAMAGAPA